MFVNVDDKLKPEIMKGGPNGMVSFGLSGTVYIFGD